MRKRRMHRAFAPEPVPRELLEKLVYAAGRAAAARAGIRHLVVVDDPGLMATFRQVCPGFVNDAPNAIAICTDLEAAERVGRQVGDRGGREDRRGYGGGAPH